MDKFYKSDYQHMPDFRGIWEPLLIYFKLWSHFMSEICSFLVKKKMKRLLVIALIKFVHVCNCYLNSISMIFSLILNLPIKRPSVQKTLHFFAIRLVCSYRPTQSTTLCLVKLDHSKRYFCITQTTRLWMSFSVSCVQKCI
jgi:hypothetical protein